MVPMLRVVSGGQTGVDRAALDAARAVGLPGGGWCPRGRRAEDGVIAADYPLRETPSEDYAQRTEWNVRDSDGTLVLARGRTGPGTAFTIERARQLGRPLLVLDLREDPDPATARQWIESEDIHVLNVAGPRESQDPGIGAAASAFLERLFHQVSTRG
jgi:hypothetical protein